MKRSILMMVLAVAISVAFVSGVMAQQKPAQAPAAAPQGQKLEKFSGTIEKVDEASKDVLVQFHKEKMTFSTDEHTKFMEGKKEVPFSDVKKGMKASVEYKKEGNKLIAESVNLSMPKSSAKKVTPTEKAPSPEKAPTTEKKS